MENSVVTLPAVNLKCFLPKWLVVTVLYCFQDQVLTILVYYIAALVAPLPFSAFCWSLESTSV